MSYQEKKTGISMFMGVLILIAYCIYAFGQVRSGAADFNDLKFFSATMMIFIGIGIAAMIVIQVLFHIALSVSVAVKEKCGDDKKIGKAIEATMVEDEMDKLIELKSGKIGFALIGAGFIAGLITLLFNCPPAVMLNILYLSFGVGSLAGGAMSIYYYRKGV
ncbi:MAG TPA: hypothetical protein PK854_02605 [Oscillospiraceae bacterium]|nr:hypothetical protein [Oscillospiraceae bacterium]